MNLSFGKMCRLQWSLTTG